MRLRYMVLTIAVLATTCALAAELGNLLPLQPPQVVFTRQAGVYLRHEAVTQLRQGENCLLFDHGRLDVDPATVEFRVLSPREGVQVLGRQIAANSGQSVWLVQARQPVEARLQLTYAAKALETEVSYTLNLRPARQDLTLEAQVALKNGGKLSLPQVQVVLPSGQRLTAALEPGQTVQQRLFRIEGIPYQTSYLYDNSRFKDSVRAILTMPRDGNSDFDKQALPAGKLKVYAPAAGDAATFIGDNALPYTPRREKVELDLGNVSEITVLRTKLRGDQVNVRTDVYRKLAVFDLEEEYELEFANHRAGRVVVAVQEHVPGDWQVLKATHEYTRRDAATLEFTVPLEPNQLTKLHYSLKRLNVEP
ncbi:MAG: hypothetical protein ABFE08_07230 [Armatimonadia bacterium]